MNTGKTVFSQLMDFFPWWNFHTCVKRYRGNYKVQRFKCSDHFRVMAFAQLTYRESLRDIEACFKALGNRRYHMGIRSGVSRNNLANANEQRDWRIYADFAQALIARARKLYAQEELGIDLDATVYALDATTIDLCLSLFPWAKFRRVKSAIKLHTQINLRGNIPEFIHISDGKMHDVNMLDLIVPEPGAYYLFDRAYIDFDRLYRFHQGKAFFVSRLKENILYQRRYSNPVDKDSGVRSDQTIILTGRKTPQYYPEPLRRIRYYAEDRDRFWEFLTNDFHLPALTIAKIYKLRWQIELFFKWIKQNLRIKTFFGTSENAVKVQIWTAVCTYLLVAIAKKELGLKPPLSQILQVLSLYQFEKTPIFALFSAPKPQKPEDSSGKQLSLFD